MTENGKQAETPPHIDKHLDKRLDKLEDNQGKLDDKLIVLDKALDRIHHIALPILLSLVLGGGWLGFTIQKAGEKINSLNQEIATLNLEINKLKQTETEIKDSLEKIKIATINETQKQLDRISNKLIIETEKNIDKKTQDALYELDKKASESLNNSTLQGNQINENFTKIKADIATQHSTIKSGLEDQENRLKNFI